MISATALWRASLFVLCVIPPIATFVRAGNDESRPALAVVISVDQMRADYLERFAPWICEGGFARLVAHGAVYSECRYGHAGTKTAPGHATILSGTHPSIHGIMANEWIEPDTWQGRVAVEDAEAPLVGITPRAWRSPGGVIEAKEGRSPRSLLATTVGDQLKIRHGAGSKVFSASIKDRSAILMGGKLADGAYWTENGRFITSTYYRSELPSWIAAFNERQLVEATFGRRWERLLSREIYDRVQGPDDAPGENSKWGLGRTFPRTIDGGTGQIGKDFYDAWYVSPFSNDVLAEFVKAAVKAEGLGRSTYTDLLCISFSQPDGIGHYAGPDSHEIMDSMLRLDRTLADFLEFLESEIGLDRCVVVLTADHGCAPMPERVHSFDRPGVTAGRIEGATLDALVGGSLAAAYGEPAENERWFIRDNDGYRLSREVLDAHAVPIADAARVVRDALLSFEAIETAFTREQILGPVSTPDSRLLKLVRNSYPPARGQDVVFVVRPFVIVNFSLGGTHGTPWDYDTHVPLVFMGGGAPVGENIEPVGVVDLATTLAPMLMVPAPPEAVGRRLF